MGRLTQAAAVLSLPPTLAHEATHWAVARLGTDDAALAVEVTGGRALAAWPPLASRPLRVFAFLAPTIFGSLLAALWLAAGVDLSGWRAIAALGLVIYTCPSATDLRGAAGRQPAQQQTEDDT